MEPSTASKYAALIAREATDTADLLDHLGITRVLALSVTAADFHKPHGFQVRIHLGSHEDVDKVADHLGLPADDGETGNYTRGHVFCGRKQTDAEVNGRLWA